MLSSLVPSSSSLSLQGEPGSTVGKEPALPLPPGQHPPCNWPRAAGGLPQTEKEPPPLWARGTGTGGKGLGQQGNWGHQLFFSFSFILVNNIV